MKRSNLLIGLATIGTGGLLLASLLLPGISGAQEGAALATKAQAILKSKCLPCHEGAAAAKGINVLKQESLLSTHAVLPRNADKSLLIEVIVNGQMPLGAGKKPGLEASDLDTLKAWVNAGAPDWNAKPVTVKPADPDTPAKPEKPEVVAPTPTARKFVTEAATLQAILHDLNAAGERDRPFLRYYSVANLSNNPEVSVEALDQYRIALSKLINHLSWNREISVPKFVDAARTLLRIDLRDYDWTPAIWQRILAAYPYGLKPRNLGGEVHQIEDLSGAVLPYVRVDWFIDHASVPPLYFDILQLPDNVAALEEKLGVNAAQDVAQEKVARGGVRNSGVSRNNRAIERHRSLYGAYWKSFDFAGNQGAQNIFKNPLEFQPAGGEFIFHLPNGLQGYLIATGAGKRLDDAPIAIVRDHETNFDDPVVHTGRSCIGCHFRGMRLMRDEMRPLLETQQKADFDVDRALALYVPQADLDRFFEQDSRQFLNALSATGAPVPANPAEEAINLISSRYEATVSVEQAAADAGLDVKEFQKRIGKNSDLEKLGFQQLLEPNGGIKRDAWEEYFGDMVEAIRLGDYIKPTENVRHRADARDDGKRTLAVEEIEGGGRFAGQVRQEVLLFLNQSDDLRLVSKGNADFTLRGNLTEKGNEITLALTDPANSINESVTGSAGNLAFLAEQLADRVNFRITGNHLPAGTETARVTRTVPTTTAQPAIQADATSRTLQVVSSGPIHIALSVDRGPGATYQMGEEVQIRFKVDRDCAITLYDIDSVGNVSLLFPNEFAPDNHVVAGQLYALPDPKDNWKIQVNGVPGKETVIAVATSGQADLPGLSDFRKDPKSKSLGVVKRNGSDTNIQVTEFAQNVGQLGRVSGGASSASIQFFTVK